MGPLLLDGEGSVVASVCEGLGGHWAAMSTRSESHCTHRHPYRMASSSKTALEGAISASVCHQE